MNCEGFIDSKFPVLRRIVHGGRSGTIKVIIQPESVAHDMRWRVSSGLTLTIEVIIPPGVWVPAIIRFRVFLEFFSQKIVSEF